MTSLKSSPPQDWGASTVTGETLRGELADAVAQIPGVEVRAAHSLTPLMARNDQALQQASQSLSLDLLVVGSLDLTPTDYHLNLELIEGKNATHLRSFHYSGPRVGLPQAATEFGNALYSEITHAKSDGASPQVIQGSTQNPQAYDFEFAATQALAARTEASIAQAIVLDWKAIGLDPQFAKAYSGLAESELVAADFGAGQGVRKNFELARAAAEKAIALNPADARAHSVLGLVLFQDDWNFAAAEHQLRMAIEQNPGLAANHMRLAIVLIDRKDFKDAHAEIALAHKLDPLWPIVYGTGMYVDIMSREYANGIRDGLALVSMRPDWGRALNQLGWAYWYAGQHKNAIEQWEQAAMLQHDALRAQLEEKGLHVLDYQGVRAYAELKLAVLGRNGANGDFVPAEWYAFAGERSQTISALQQMVDRHDPESLKIPINPAYDFLKDDPQFRQLLHRIDFSLPAQ